MASHPFSPGTVHQFMSAFYQFTADACAACATAGQRHERVGRRGDTAVVRVRRESNILRWYVYVVNDAVADDDAGGAVNDG